MEVVQHAWRTSHDLRSLERQPRFKLSALLAGAATLGLLASPSLTSPPYTVSSGGSEVAFEAEAEAEAGSVTFTIHDGNGERVWTCTNVTINGLVNTGSGINPIASITGIDWGRNCSYAGLPVTMSGNYAPTWDFTGTSAATSDNTDDIAGNIDRVNGNIALGGTCSFDVTGSIDTILHEGSQTIDLNETAGNLTASNKSSALGCLGQISNGDHLDLQGTFDITTGAPLYLS